VGQKVHPLGFRLGSYKTWGAHWFAKRSYSEELQEDIQVREFIKSRLNDTDIAEVVIEKAGQNLRLVIHSSRPGTVIGKRGQGIEQLREELHKKFNKTCDVSVQEVKEPELVASLVAKGIAEQIERRVGYKRLMKRAGFAAIRAGARGIKIRCAGRLGGAEIARDEWLRLGSVPLHTLRADIDYALAEAKTTYGMIGIKVWICRGEL
jgi:small subunit ribosomal protein S3